MRTAQEFKKLCFEKTIADNTIVKNFSRIQNIEIFIYSSDQELDEMLNSFKLAGVESREVLILKEFKGRIFQDCPASKNVICCNYRLINTGFGCLYNCMYCFLHTYLNSYGITQFVNTDDFIEQIKDNLPVDNSKIYRLGTGEFTDSLMMDTFTGISEKILTGLFDRNDIMVELKTKSNNIDHLLKVKHNNSSIIAWSLNTERNIKKYEYDAASLNERLYAALKAQEHGFLTAFHFDPVIIYENYMEDYLALIDTMFKLLDGNKIVWISIGGFRYAAGFKEAVNEVFLNQDLTAEEMFPGTDGKFRYLRFERESFYRAMYNQIKLYSSKPFVYLCMETEQVWQNSFGFSPKSTDDLEDMMSKHLMENFHATPD
jgi:spore photoproduct lyase